DSCSERFGDLARAIGALRIYDKHLIGPLDGANGVTDLLLLISGNDDGRDLHRKDLYAGGPARRSIVPPNVIASIAPPDTEGRKEIKVSPCLKRSSHATLKVSSCQCSSHPVAPLPICSRSLPSVRRMLTFPNSGSLYRP